MDYLIYDKRVSYEIASKTGVVELEELPILFGNNSLDLNLAVVKVNCAVIVSDSSDPEIIERIASEHFQGDQLLQFEPISETEFQVFGLEKNQLESKGKSLSGNQIKAIVPYQVAVRVFIKENLPKSDEFLIFLDDRGDSILFSVFNQDVVSGVRALPVAPNRLVFELIRSAQNYRNERSLQNVVFGVFTNSAVVKDAIINLSDHPIIDKTRIHFNVQAYPAIAGLKTKQPLLRFILPEELEKVQLERKRKRYGNFFSTASLVCAVAFTFYIAAVIQRFLIKNKLSDLTSQEKEIKQHLSQAYLDKHRGLVEKGGRESIPAYYLREILLRLPTYLYRLDSVELKKNILGKKSLQIGLITRADLKGGLKHLKKIYPEAQIYETIAKDRLAVMMTITLD